MASPAQAEAPDLGLGTPAPGSPTAQRARRSTRVALACIAALFVLAALADFIASDLPLVLYLDGELYMAPQLVRPAALRAQDNQRLRARLGPRDWAVFPPVPWGANSHDLTAVCAPPGARHLLGTDAGGRDVLSRLVHGTRVSLLVGVLAVGVMLVLGVPIGALSGYVGGVWDAALMRMLEAVHALPTLLVLVTVLSIYAPEGWTAVVVTMTVIGMLRWTDVARLLRAEVLRVRELPYVEAARALGLGEVRVLVRHVLPGALGPVLVSAAFGMPAAMLLEGALSFLGFGIPPDMASWGGMLNGVRTAPQAWWLAAFPGAAIFLTVTVYNLAGEGLRDAIEPRQRHE